MQREHGFRVYGSDVTHSRRGGRRVPRGERGGSRDEEKPRVPGELLAWMLLRVTAIACVDVACDSYCLCGCCVRQPLLQKLRCTGRGTRETTNWSGWERESFLIGERKEEGEVTCALEGCASPPQTPGLPS
eukprot:195529-Chlamydomonas_euryale.AAC.6